MGLIHTVGVVGGYLCCISFVVGVIGALMAYLRAPRVVGDARGRVTARDDGQPRKMRAGLIIVLAAMAMAAIGIVLLATAGDSCVGSLNC